jgi:hypothetical protein
MRGKNQGYPIGAIYRMCGKMAMVIASHLAHSKMANRVKSRLGHEVSPSSPSGAGTLVQHCQVRLQVPTTKHSKASVTLFNNGAKNARLLKPWPQLKGQRFNPNE